MILIKFFLLLCLICCSNCSTNKLANRPTGYLMANRNNLLMQGHTTNFVDGYIDGCKSGQNAAGDNLFRYTKDESRAELEHDYLVGWEQGNSFCYEHMRDLIKNNNKYPDPYYSQEALEREKERLWSELKK